MQKFSAIFLAFLLTLNIVCSMRLSPLDTAMLPSNSIRSTLAQMLTKVRTMDAESNPKTLKAFTDQIKHMITQLQAEQAKHEEISKSMMEQCAAEETFRAAEVADANNALNRATDARNKCDASLTSARKDLPELQAALVVYEDELKAATELRAAQNASYLQRKADYEQAIAFLGDFIEYVRTNLNIKPVSFVEKSESLLRHATKLRLLKEVVPILVALASHQEVPTTQNTYAYAGRTDLAETLKTTLNTLLARIEADHADNEAVEVAAQAAYDALKLKLDAAIETLKSNITRTEKQITDMVKCVADEDLIIKTAGSKLANNTNLRNSAAAMCANFALEFIEATKNRFEEIKTIKEILEIIVQRFGQIATDLVSQLEEVENGWKNYINSTAFKEYIAYQQLHTLDNESGRALVGQENLLQ